MEDAVSRSHREEVSPQQEACNILPFELSKKMYPTTSQEEEWRKQCRIHCAPSYNAPFIFLWRNEEAVNLFCCISVSFLL